MKSLLVGAFIGSMFDDVQKPSYGYLTMISIKKKPAQPPLAVVILAAGKGTRMQSEKPKVLHEVADKPMLAHVLTSARQLKPEHLVVIVGYQAAMVQEAFRNAQDVQWAHQEGMKGTGHAVQFAHAPLAHFEGDVLVLYGDVPAITVKTLQTLIRTHQDAQAAVTMLTANVAKPTGYGRIIKNQKGCVCGIVEEKDASEAQKQISEINTGIGVYDAAFLFESVFALDCNNQQNEYYLTDVVAMAAKQGKKVTSLCLSSDQEVQGINDLPSLAHMDAWMRQHPAFD
jgi:UDP-N-acetylglucosamine diphosphorylase/glucosamine-1-phosphate N-acetyltransferase